MRTVERFVQLNAERQRALTAARKHPRIHPRGASGIRRDRAEAKALRNYRKGLTSIIGSTHAARGR